MLKYIYTYLLINTCAAVSLFEDVLEGTAERRATACVGVAVPGAGSARPGAGGIGPEAGGTGSGAGGTGPGADGTGLGAGSGCPGLLWRRDWLLVRHSCLSAHRLAPIVVKMGVVNCTYETITKGISDACFHHVVARYKHPLYPEVDLALLQLDHPYADTMEGLNYTRNDNFLQKIDIWIKNIVYAERIQREHMYEKQLDMNNYMKMYWSPLRMFLFTVVLPSVSFIMFFMYIIFFTGTSKNVKIPYKKFNNEKKNSV